MNTTLRLASMSVLLLGVALGTNGCVISDCGDGDSSTTCAETGTKYLGPDETLSAAWTAGQSLTIKNDNGQIEVNVGAADTVSVTFKPFTFGGNDAKAEEEAKREMDQDLTYVAGPGEGGVLIDADRASGSNDFLGADMVVSVPSNFDGALIIDSGNGGLSVGLGGLTTAAIGALDVTQGNGDVSVDLGATPPTSTRVYNNGAGDIQVLGAAGPIDIRGDFDVELSVGAWAATGQNGTVVAGGPGDISVTVPGGANGSIQATACGDDGLVNEPSSLPTDWTVEAAAPGSKTFTFGTMGGANLVVTCDGLIGNVSILAGG